jgi:hypothetical protein
VDESLESLACIPSAVSPDGFNPNAQLPYGLTTQHLFLAMRDYTEFLGLINHELHARGLPRLESLLMPANFSSIVGEMMAFSIPKYCPGLVKNLYHNGHPDLIPANRFPGNAVQYTHEGIEIKASRYSSGWQGHNPEAVWLMIFIFDSNRPGDVPKGIAPKPFRFIRVLGAPLEKEDWVYAGRSETSRRTITASVTASGYHKLMANWIYQPPDL